VAGRYVGIDRADDDERVEESGEGSRTARRTAAWDRRTPGVELHRNSKSAGDPRPSYEVELRVSPAGCARSAMTRFIATDIEAGHRRA